MGTKIGTLKDRETGDDFLPRTDSSLVTGLEDLATIRRLSNGALQYTLSGEAEPVNPAQYESTTNKTTELDNESTNTEYPSAKAVVDALGKWGVVSQTINWSGNGSIGWTHSVSDLVFGLISIDHIELFKYAGATFNETTGYFELNEILDISYDEMLSIYVNSIGALPFNVNRNSQFNKYPYRTTIQTRFSAGYSTSANHMFVDSKYLETAYFEGCNNLSATTNTFQRCSRLRKIIGTLAATSWSDSVFEQCPSLEYLRIEKLRSNLSLNSSSKIDLESIVFIVENATNTTAITITLHSTAYARCQADTTTYTYNGNTYTGILAYAAAKNITIASA